MNFSRANAAIPGVVLFLCLIFSPAKSASAAEKVRIGLSTRNVVLMPFYYAKDKKLFDKQGLDVEIIQIRSNLQLAGLVSGELDFITGIGTAIEGVGKGIPVKAVPIPVIKSSSPETS